MFFRAIFGAGTIASLAFFVRAQKGAHADFTGRANEICTFCKLRSRSGAATMKIIFEEKCTEIGFSILGAGSELFFLFLVPNALFFRLASRLQKTSKKLKHGAKMESPEASRWP